MSLLLQLPAELLSHILSNLTAQGDVYRVLLSCRLLKLHARQLLYRKVVITDYKRGFQSLLCTLMKNPELKNEVRILCAYRPRLHNGISPNPTQKEIIMMQACMKETQATLARAGSPRELLGRDNKSWCEACFDDCSPRAVVASLLCQLPNLEALVTEGLDGEARWMREVLRYASKGPSAILPKLRTVRARTMSDKTVGFSTWYAMMRVPNVTRIYVDELMDLNYHTSWQWQLHPNTLRATHLCLSGCRLKARSITDIVASCRLLLSFSYSYFHSEGASSKTPKLATPKDVVEALRPHSQTLQRIHLNFDDQSRKPSWDRRNQDCLIIGNTLADFVKLRTLTINQDAITHADVSHLPTHLDTDCDFAVSGMLPTSIERLSILYCGPSITEKVTQMAQMQSRAFPNLRTIELWYEDTRGRVTEKDQDDLRRNRTQGVEYRLERMPLPTREDQLSITAPPSRDRVEEEMLDLVFPDG